MPNNSPMPSIQNGPQSLVSNEHETEDDEPGGLLGELERRQDDVIAQLEDLDAQLNEVLKGLEPERKSEASSEDNGFFAAEH